MKYLKRVSDVILSASALLILSPLLLFIGLLIKLDSKGPILYRQQRVGENGIIFTINKFRTMIDGAEGIGAGYVVKKGDQRITRLGKILRSLSLDELPQLLNILLGEMSLVGPRPTLPYQVDKYDERQRQRLKVKPGVTGWAQVNGRNAISWPKRIELDLWYIDSWTIWLDLKILLLTFKSILVRDNIYRTADYDPISDPNSSASKENEEKEEKLMIAIIGAGGHGKCVYECFYLAGEKVFGFFDDDLNNKGKEVIDGQRVIGLPAEIAEYNHLNSLFLAIGDNRSRLEKYRYYQEKGFRFPNAVHQRAYRSPFAELGEGNFIMGAAVINPDSKIGNCCIINTSATIGHDCVFEDGVQIGPGVNLAGGVILKEGVFIGIGAKVAPGVTIGCWAVVGAGSVVIEDIPAQSFCVGIPAKAKRKPGKFCNY